MKFSKRVYDPLDLGIFLEIQVSDQDVFSSEAQRIDQHRTVATVYLAAAYRSQWLDAISHAIRQLRVDCLYCPVTIDYSNWCKFFRANEAYCLEKMLPVTVSLRISGVPDSYFASLQRPARYSDVANQIFLKKRRYAYHKKKNCHGASA